MHCKHSTKRPAVGALFALAMAGTATCAIGQGVPLPAIEQVIEFKPGTAKARAALAKVASVRDLIAGDFLIAGVDLNDDGRKEILVMGSSSTSCGSGGCLLVVLEQQGNKVVTLLSQNVPNSLGVTKEKIGAYRSLAAVDGNGAILAANRPGAPLHGKAMVYAIPSLRAQGAAPDATPMQQEFTSSGSGARADGAVTGVEVLGLRLGMSVIETRNALRSQTPSVTELRSEDSEYAGLPGSRSLKEIQVMSRLHGLIVLQFSPPPLPPRLIRISRTADSGSAPDLPRSTIENMLAALKAKYGSPAKTHDEVPGGASISLWWAWRRDGSVAPAAFAGAGASCQALVSHDPWEVIPQRTRETNPVHPQCGTTLHIRLNQSSGVVHAIYVRALGVGYEVDAKQAAESAMAGVQRANERRERDAASRNKPSL